MARVGGGEGWGREGEGGGWAIGEGGVDVSCCLD